MFDVFYIGTKPNQFAHEREVNSIEEAQRLSRTRYFWIIHYLCDYSEFDFLWEPKPWEAHQRHVYASQWNKDSGTCLYPKAGWNDTQYHAGMIAYRNPSKDNWNNTEVDGFDYSWHPDPTEPPFIYKFGTQWQKTGGPTYIVPGAVNIKYVDKNRVNKTSVDEYWDNLDYEDFDYTWHPDLTEGPHIYQFGTQWQKTGGPRYVMPGANIVKYVSEPRCTKTSVDNNWVVPEGVGEFDYTWHPDSSEPPMNYQFGTQWQKTGGPLYKVDGATETKYVSQIKVENISISRDVYLIDHGNPETEKVIKTLEEKGCTIKKKARFISSYKGTLQRILNQETNEFVWICSSICDYSNFDFSWHPEQWQGTMLHVFPSQGEKFGDTFLINVPSFNARIKNTEILEWYDTLHFVDNIDVPRWPMPVVHYNTDTVVNTVWDYTFDTPFVVFTKLDVLDQTKLPAVNYWREKTRTVTPLSLDSSTAIIPREAKNHLKTQIYDYPYILKTNRSTFSSVQQDIVYISYDEPESEENYEKLKCLYPNVKRVHGVKGMEQALIAGAEASNTPWYYAVFAKTAIEPSFKFDFVPDYFQVPKHYIFNCRNRVNGLEYGHMGIVLYNCEMVKNGPGYYTDKMGLDYTVSFPSESIPLLSCHGNFDTSPFHTWRTSFREVAKLSLFQSQNPTFDNEYRLKIWTTKAEGPYAEWALKGAADGVEFFKETGGDLEKMKASFDWEWLRDRFVSRHGELD